MDDPILKRKISLLGEGAVGKTSLFRRYVEGAYDDHYVQTIGTNVSVKSIRVPEEDHETELKLQIWDIMGQGRFERIIAKSIAGSAGAFLVCDLTRLPTIKALPEWADRVREQEGDIPIVILANKTDIAPHPEEYISALTRISWEVRAPYLFTSAKENSGVEEGFQVLARFLIDEERYPRPPPQAGEDIAIRERTQDPAVLALDQILDIYCFRHGGVEAAMPAIREAIETLDLKWGMLTSSAVQAVVDQLVPEDTEDAELELERGIFLNILRMTGPMGTPEPTLEARPKSGLEIDQVVRMRRGQLLLECRKHEVDIQGTTEELRERLISTLGD